MRRRAAIALVIGAGAIAACQVIAGIDRVEKVTEGSATDASSSSSGAVQNPNDPCKHVLPPLRPANDSDGGPNGTDHAYYFATQTLSLTKPAANGISGIDLDGTCTCDRRAGTAFDGGGSCNPPAGGTVACDPDGGIDNEGLSLFGTIFAAIQGATASDADGGIDFQQTIQDDITAGRRTVMLYVSDWNGLPDDTDVSSSLFISEGTFDPSDPSHENNPLFHPVPQFDGTDVWTYPDTASIGHEGSVFVPQALQPGYVANGRLVVQNNTVVTVIFGSAGLPFADSIVLGDLGQDANGKRTFTGILGGRIRQTDLLSAAGQIREDNAFVCNAPPEFGLQPYDIVKTFICPAADIEATKGKDNTNATCDSISSTLAFQAIEATIDGTPTTSSSTQNPCAPGASDAPSYTCP